MWYLLRFHATTVERTRLHVTLQVHSMYRYTYSVPTLLYKDVSVPVEGIHKFSGTTAQLYDTQAHRRLHIVCKHLAWICWCFLYYSIMLWEQPSYWLDCPTPPGGEGGFVMGESRERYSSRFHPIRSVQRSCRKWKTSRLIQREREGLLILQCPTGWRKWDCGPSGQQWQPQFKTCLNHRSFNTFFNVSLLYWIDSHELFMPWYYKVFPTHSSLDTPCN